MKYFWVFKLLPFVESLFQAEQSIVAAPVGGQVPVGKIGGLRLFGRRLSLNLTATVDA